MDDGGIPRWHPGAPEPTLAGGATVVTLPSGHVASAMVEALDADLGSSCRYFPALLVTPPDARASTRIPVLLSGMVTELPDCGGFQVHPVTPGRAGGERSTAVIEVRAQHPY
jgi:hypothetical protein